MNCCRCTTITTTSRSTSMAHGRPGCSGAPSQPVGQAGFLAHLTGAHLGDPGMRLHVIWKRNVFIRLSDFTIWGIRLDFGFLKTSYFTIVYRIINSKICMCLCYNYYTTRGNTELQRAAEEDVWHSSNSSEQPSPPPSCCCFKGKHSSGSAAIESVLN